ncbi:hypothetical protein QFZ22_000611 [Streptomyces canus]|uniref:Uncharacterized protein n=1 Tax=Streptomyces canus TaxID=58343 RepID=A0AAW8F3G4_9ACTN|nr:hypothetical protein [Streptomyces canus]MDQ0904626.1 hypothetical protein [Streptomyces canus]
MITPRRHFPLVTHPMTTAAQRQLWTLSYQRVVGSARSELRSHAGRRRLDVQAADGTKIEFQQSKDSVPNTHSKELSHATGLMWVFSAINQHFTTDLLITSRQGARANFTWTNPWRLIASCNARTMLDLGLSPQIGAHVLLEVDHFELGTGTAFGTAVLRDAQEFCHWMRDGHPLLPYAWTPRAA